MGYEADAGFLQFYELLSVWSLVGFDGFIKTDAMPSAFWVSTSNQGKEILHHRK